MDADVNFDAELKIEQLERRVKRLGVLLAIAFLGLLALAWRVIRPSRIGVYGQGGNHASLRPDGVYLEDRDAVRASLTQSPRESGLHLSKGDAMVTLVTAEEKQQLELYSGSVPALRAEVERKWGSELMLGGFDSTQVNLQAKAAAEVSFFNRNKTSTVPALDER